MIEWEKVNSSTWQGFVGRYHMFTVVSNKGFFAKLMPQFYGYDSKGDREDLKNIHCSGGFTEAKRKAKKILTEFISDVSKAEKDLQS